MNHKGLYTSRTEWQKSTNMCACHPWPSRRHTSNMWRLFVQRWPLGTYMSCSYVQVTTPFSAIFFVLFFVPLPMGRHMLHVRVRISSDTDWLSKYQAMLMLIIFVLNIDYFPQTVNWIQKNMIPIPGRMNTLLLYSIYHDFSVIWLLATVVKSPVYRNP